MNKLREILASAMLAIAFVASIGMGFIVLGAGIAFGAIMALIFWLSPKELNFNNGVHEQSDVARPNPV